MGIGFGPGSDMMKAYKANRDQIKKKPLKDRYDKSKKKTGNQQLSFKTMSKAELESFRAQLAEDKRKERQKTLAILVLTKIIVAIGLWLLMF